MRTVSSTEARNKTRVSPEEVKPAVPQDQPVPSGAHTFAHLAASYEGKWWDDLLDEIKNNRERDVVDNEAR